MTPTQDFENYPEFANAGNKSQPNDAKYAAGFIPSDVLPAEWLNWFLNGATKGVTALNTGVKSVEQEINSVLESRSVTPDINAAGQLLSVLNKIKAEAVLAAHPVGSLYWTSKNENPAVTFGGGTWKQITDKFVLAAGSTYKVEATGGAATVTLTTSNMPSHSHSFTPSGTIKMNSHSHGLNNHIHTYTPSGNISSNGGHWHKFFTTDSGMGTSNTPVDNFDNMAQDTSSEHMTDENYIRAKGTVYYFPPEAWANSANRNTAPDVEGIGYKYSHTKNYYHSESAVTSWSGYHRHSFIGYKSETSASSGNTTSTTSTGSFTGSSGTTNTNGSGTAFSIIPPYVVKYCFERTA